VNANAKGTRMMWNPSVNAICSRAGSNCEGWLALETGSSVVSAFSTTSEVPQG
jgi:hypothetical protein